MVDLIHAVDGPSTNELPIAGSRKRPRRRWGFLARRLGFYLVAAWSAITLNFMIPRVMPGDPADQIIRQIEQNSGQPASAEAVYAIQRLFGDPRANLAQQYWDYLRQLGSFDLGLSTSRFPVQVGTLIGSGLPWTIALVGMTTLAAFLLGTGLGVIAGWRVGSRLDSFLAPMSTFVGSVPYFWVALIALWLFGFQLGWFPLTGGYDPDTPPGFSPAYAWGLMHHGLLPAATIVFSSFGGWLLGMRNMTATTVGEDYVLLARAKGLSPARIMFRYAARNAVLPSFTGFALALGGIVSGALLTEMVFNYPGIGYLLYDAVSQRDYPLMQGLFLVVTLAVLLTNFLADSLYVLLDPRTREQV